MAAVQAVDANTLNAWIAQDDVLMIDVREPHEHARAHIPAAKLMPLSTLGSAELPDADGKKVVIVCASGARSMMAADRLFAHHYPEVYNLHGGMSGWRMAGLPVGQDENAAASAFPGFWSMLTGGAR